jgi:hypothetical protein
VTGPRTIRTPAERLRPDDLVLLDDGNRTVASVTVTPMHDRVAIEWTDGGQSTWLAIESCWVVRR